MKSLSFPISPLTPKLFKLIKLMVNPQKHIYMKTNAMGQPFVLKIKAANNELFT